MNYRDELIKGIEECDLNGGLIGNCPYKYIITLLKEKEIEIEHLKLIIKNDTGDYKYNGNNGELVLCKDCRKNMMCELTLDKPKDWFCADGIWGD